MENRVWNRGSSKGRNPSGQAIQQQLSQNSDQDSIQSTLQKSLIASIVSGARGERASLNEPNRPFTPADMPRHLVHGDDYSNRPISSYKMKNVVGQAIDEFSNTVNQSVSTTTSTGATAKKGPARGGSQNKEQNILSILEQAENAKKRGNKLPALDPIQQNKGLKQISKKNIKAFESGKPIKVLEKQESSEQEMAAQLPKNLEQKKQAYEETKRSPKKPPSNIEKEDFAELLTEKAKQEESQIFEKHRQENEALFQSLTQQLQSANKGGGGGDEGDEEEDEYEEYFAMQMMADMKNVEGDGGVDYDQVLQNIQEKIGSIDQKVVKGPVDEEEAYLMQNIEEEEKETASNYEREYNEVVREIGSVCAKLQHNAKAKDNKKQINEEDVMELSTRVWALASSFAGQSEQVRQHCFLETLLKGTFTLLGVKSAKCGLRISTVNIELFFKLFDKYLEKNEEQRQDFLKVFNYLFETIRGVLIYAKEGKHDALFVEEQLAAQLIQVVSKVLNQHSHKVSDLASQVVNKKVIKNDDLVYDAINYCIGSMKCFTQSSLQVQQHCVKLKYIQILSKAIDTTLAFGANSSKQSMILLQITGTIRNLSNDEEAYMGIVQGKVLPKVINMLQKFKGHKELTLNISRLLSKVSLDPSCASTMIDSSSLAVLMDAMEQYQDNPTILIRIAFALGNLTTHFEEVRTELTTEQAALERTLKIALYYLEKDENMEAISNQKIMKKQEDKGNLSGGIEDSLTKLIRLVANLCTDEESSLRSLKSLSLQVTYFVSKLVEAISRRATDKSEDFILNSISCITNILFFDIPAAPLLPAPLRVELFYGVKSFILYTQNEEMQIESARVLSNLSRHADLCEEFVSDKDFLSTVILVLDNTLRDLVYYCVGIIINITLHARSRSKVIEKGAIDKLVGVLKDSNIEDLDLSKVAAKSIHNMTGESSFWTKEQSDLLDQVLTSLGDELDSIMDVATEDEQLELKQLRDLVNALVNDMPQAMFSCGIGNCGRKFKNKDELDNHIQRRHGDNKK